MLFSGRSIFFIDMSTHVYVPVGVRITHFDNKENIPPITSTPKRVGSSLLRVECSICGAKDPRKCSSSCSDNIVVKLLKEHKKRVFLPISEEHF